MKALFIFSNFSKAIKQHKNISMFFQSIKTYFDIRIVTAAIKAKEAKLSPFKNDEKSTDFFEKFVSG